MTLSKQYKINKNIRYKNYLNICFDIQKSGGVWLCGLAEKHVSGIW